MEQAERPLVASPATRPLRVGWLVPGFPSSPDDPSYVFLAREAVALAGSPDVELVVLSEGAQPSPELGPFEVAGIEPRRGFGPRAWDLARYTLAAWPASRPALAGPRVAAGETGRAIAAVRQLRRFSPDVIHSHFAVPAGTCGVTVARVLDASSVVSLRGVDLAVDPDIGYGFRLAAAFERRFRASLPCVDWCLTATQTMRELAIDAGAPESRSTVLKNQIDRFWSEPHQPHQKPKGAQTLVLSVGGLTELKGFDRGVRSLAIQPDSVHYAIIGEGPFKAHLLALAAEFGVSERLHLLGSLPPGEVARWMRTADVYWFLSRREAFGNVVLEALATGLPIVATPCGIAADLRPDMGFLLLSCADDPTELARLTFEVLRSPVSDRDLSLFAPELRTHDLIKIYRAAMHHRASTSR